MITIAIVDTDATTRAQVTKLFGSSSYIVEEFESSEQLLNSSSLSKLNCLMLSPEATYTETKKLINAIRKQNKETAIIAIGENDELAQAVTCLRAGADDYLFKPLNNGTIRALVRQLLAK